MNELGVCEKLAQLEEFDKDIFDLQCLLADRERNYQLITHRINQMRDSYSFLKNDLFIDAKKE